MEADLTGGILPFWLEHTVDPAGGFYGTVRNDGSAVPDADKGAVLNARILWTFSRAWALKPALQERIFASIASYLEFLKNDYGVEADFFSFNESDLGIDVVHTPEQHRDFIKAFGRYLVDRGLKTKMLLGDNSDATTYDFIVPALEDPEALRSASACRCSWPKAVRTPRRTSIPPSSTSPPSGSNQASFAGGVGAESATVGYGLNRADWSYIPGGAVSGTALIRPDFPELLTFPYLWQQVEYVLGGGSSHYMFLVLAARDLVGE